LEPKGCGSCGVMLGGWAWATFVWLPVAWVRRASRGRTLLKKGELCRDFCPHYPRTTTPELLHPNHTTPELFTLSHYVTDTDTWCEARWPFTVAGDFDGDVAATTPELFAHRLNDYTWIGVRGALVFHRRGSVSTAMFAPRQTSRRQQHSSS
jgi:hypothetical protein